MISFFASMIVYIILYFPKRALLRFLNFPFSSLKEYGLLAISSNACLLRLKSAEDSRFIPRSKLAVATRV